MTDADPLLARLRTAQASPGTLPEFDPSRAADAPGPLFAEWLSYALDEGVAQPQTMTLSTVDSAGRPSSRVLFLRGFDLDGQACAFRFATDAGSRKSADLAVRPYAALNWYWAEQGRQIRAAGPVETLDAEVAREDFLGRSEASRIDAFIGRMSAPLAGAREYERERARARAAVAADPEAIPEAHRVYRLRAEEVEFYQLAENRFHRRVRYTRDGPRWQREQLWP